MRLTHTTAHSKSHYGPFDPKLTIAGESIQYLGDHDFKYLGRQMNTQLSENTCRNDIKTILVALLKDLITPIWPPQQSSGYTIIFAPQSSHGFCSSTTLL